jgi:anti-sigma-K factor RskA
MSPCERGIDAGAYVLGALEPDERDAFAAHLEGCEGCRSELATLRGAADALPLAAPQVPPPPELEDRIMAVVRSEATLLRAAGAAADRPAPRRRRLRLRALVLRPLPAAALACALLAIGVGAGALIEGGSGGGHRQVAARVMFAGAPRARATLDIAAGGASLRLQGVPAPPAGKVYEVWLERRPGAYEPTDALFTVGPRGDASVNVPGDLEGVRHVLVTAEPRGGSAQPTSAPVIVATPA